ncbi:MAG: hypothetical protein IKI53_04320, partial [Firmicutes bacterium]|nr:hypothetical protein [Bacillota bacterium]
GSQHSFPANLRRLLKKQYASLVTSRAVRDNRAYCAQYSQDDAEPSCLAEIVAERILKPEDRGRFPDDCADKQYFSSFLHEGHLFLLF